MSELLFGFDPSLAHFGYAVAHRPPNTRRLDWLAAGVIVTKPGDAPTKTEDNRVRVEGIARELRQLVERFGRPDVIAVEALALPLGQTSLVTVSALGRCRGLIDALCAECGVTAREFQPQALKKAVTGRRDAEKASVEFEIATLYPDLLDLFGGIRVSNREHAADAAAAIHAALTQHNHEEQ